MASFNPEQHPSAPHASHAPPQMLSGPRHRARILIRELKFSPNAKRRSICWQHRQPPAFASPEDVALNRLTDASSNACSPAVLLAWVCPIVLGSHLQHGNQRVLLRETDQSSAVGMRIHPYTRGTRAHTCTYACAWIQTTTTPARACNLRAHTSLEREPRDGFGDHKEGQDTFLNHPFVSWRTQYGDTPPCHTKLRGIITIMTHIPVLAPKTVFDRFQPLCKTHISWSFQVLAPTSQFRGETRKLGSNTDLTAGCRALTDAAASPGSFCLYEIIFGHPLQAQACKHSTLEHAQALTAQFCTNTCWHGIVPLLKHPYIHPTSPSREFSKAAKPQSTKVIKQVISTSLSNTSKELSKVSRLEQPFSSPLQVAPEQHFLHLTPH